MNFHGNQSNLTKGLSPAQTDENPKMHNTRNPDQIHKTDLRFNSMRCQKK